MSDEHAYPDDSSSVHIHLGLVQAVIQRMASNSASCKTWCITLVAGILIVVADKGKPAYALIAVIPTFLFLALDTYYLALELRFRDAYNDFVGKVHKKQLVATDFYEITPKGSLCKSFASSLCSFSIWPFYVMLGLMIWLSMHIVITK